MLRWDADAASYMPTEVWSSSSGCDLRWISSTPECALIATGLGKGLRLSTMSTTQKLRYFYNAPLSNETHGAARLPLVDMVAQLYQGDIAPFNYTFPM